MFYRQSRDTFIRSIGEYGYIFSQLTKHDRTYTQEGRAFLEVLSRVPQSIESLAVKACEYFEEISPSDIQADLQDFLESLVVDRYLVSGSTAEECAAKDTYFSYAENPKTLFMYNAQQNPDDEKFYADTQDVLGAYYRKHPQIHSCQIETTSRCNERCIHCYIPHELKNVVLPYELMENVLQQLHDMGVMGLTLSGGEFFTHPDAEKILRKARELDFSFAILSNITLLNSAIIEVLKEVNPAIVQTSLYSVIPEEHDHVTQLKGSCEKTKAAIDALVAANIPVQINCPVMKSTYHSYKDVLKFAYERNCKAQTDYILMARFDFTTDNLAERLTLEQTEELLEDIIQFDKNYLDFTDVPVPRISREEWNKKPFCGVGLDSLCIANDGIVYPCAGWQGMACGNVREQPIKDIWEKSPQLNKLRNLTKSAIPQCYDCEDRQFCAPCLVRNFNESGGDYLKVAPHFCKATHLNHKLVEEAKAKIRAKQNA
ncbi:MAG: radical SAM protein [Bacteroidaceae bacterium]|nr:radical SAM protein [Bacteroidaceae bacterium]